MMMMMMMMIGDDGSGDGYQGRLSASCI